MDIKKLLTNYNAIPLLSEDPIAPDVYDTWMLKSPIYQESQLICNIGGMPILSTRTEEEIFLKIKTLNDIKSTELK